MDPLLVGLVAVDEMHGGQRMRQLSDGWMGWEWKGGRRLRVLSARALLAVARWLVPVQPQGATIEPAAFRSAR